MTERVLIKCGPIGSTHTDIYVDGMPMPLTTHQPLPSDTFPSSLCAWADFHVGSEVNDYLYSEESFSTGLRRCLNPTRTIMLVTLACLEKVASVPSVEVKFSPLLGPNGKSSLQRHLQGCWAIEYT